MPMNIDDHDDAGLETYFDSARRTAPLPSEAMLARIMADAERVRAGAPSAASHRPLKTRLRDLLGGWPTMAGLATAALAGLWIGTGLPGPVPGTGEPEYLVDITPEMAFDLALGDD